MLHGYSVVQPLPCQGNGLHSLDVLPELQVPKVNGTESLKQVIKGTGAHHLGSLKIWLACVLAVKRNISSLLKIRVIKKLKKEDLKPTT